MIKNLIKKNLHELFIDIKDLSIEHNVLDDFILTKKIINKIDDF
jgi:hypothetical protein